MLYCLIDPTKNIIKDDLRLQWTNEKLFVINIYLSFYSQKGPQFVVSLRDRWRDIYSERGLLLVSYLLLGARAYQRLHPLASCIVRDASDRLRIPGSTLDSLHSVKICLRGSHHVVSFQLYTCWTWLLWHAALFTNHNVTTCQSTRGH